MRPNLVSLPVKVIRFPAIVADLFTVFLLPFSLSASLFAQPAQGREAPRPLMLTPAQSSGEGVAIIVAPGNRQHNYMLYPIDTRQFVSGGVLHIEIELAPNSSTDGSFDLFAGDAASLDPTHPGTTLLGRYDVHRGNTTRMDFSFESGQLFALGMEGNWFSSRDSTGTVRVHARVDVAAAQFESNPAGRTLTLTPATDSMERSVAIAAPGNGRHGYSVFYIDTRSFARGVLVIDIAIASNSSTDASFDLFPGDVTPQTLINPGRASLLGRYDVRRGTATRMEYRFQPGKIFAFGLEGNWSNPKGASGEVRFRASVSR